MIRQYNNVMACAKMKLVDKLLCLGHFYSSSGDRALYHKSQNGLKSQIKDARFQYYLNEFPQK